MNWIARHPTKAFLIVLVAWLLSDSIVNAVTSAMITVSKAV